MKKKGTLGGIFAMALILALTFVLSVGSVSAAEPTIVDSGNCGANGDNITWTLDDAGTLTISGEGEMGKFQYSGDYPWLNRMNEIKAVRIEDGVTNIGGGARCSNYRGVDPGQCDCHWRICLFQLYKSEVTDNSGQCDGHWRKGVL